MMPAARVAAMAALLLWSLAGSAPAANEAGAAGRVESAVTGVVQHFVRAWNRHDTQALTSLFAPGGTLTTPRGVKAQGRQEIRELLTKEHAEIYKGTTLIVGAMQVEDAGTATPVVSGSYTLKGLDAALWIDVAVEGTFEFSFVRQGGRWLIASARISRQ